MRLRAERVLSSELRVGDLFSTRGADYWNAHFPGSLDGPVGERVFIRTRGVPDPDDQETPVYRLTIFDPLEGVTVE